jgi:hypothetical protein
VTEPQPVESVFSRAWDLLTRNWIIIVPGIVVGLIVGVVTALLTPSYDTGYANDPTAAMAGVGGALLRGMILAGVGILGYIVNQAYTVGMAGAAWQRGTTTLADGAASFQEDAGRIVITAIGLIGLGIVAAILAIPTLTLSLLAFWVFTLYAMPAAIIGNRDRFSGIAESFQIAMKRFGPTVIIAIVLAVISFCVRFIALLFTFAPFVGPIVAAVLVQIAVAFATLVIVGEYLNLRDAGTIPPPGPVGTVRTPS